MKAKICDICKKAGQPVTHKVKIDRRYQKGRYKGSPLFHWKKLDVCESCGQALIEAVAAI